MSISRRAFCATTAIASTMNWKALAFVADPNDRKGYNLVCEVDRPRIFRAAKLYLSKPPATITSFPSSKSPGGPHDFFSQADYFWPNPANPDGPYVNRDGQSNPENFSSHRKAMIALSIRMPALTAAWLLTGDRRYGRHAADHLRAWFVAPETRMNPNLEFAQGVHGVSTGRSYGIIDTLHLVEVARAASLVASTWLMSDEQTALMSWFREYLHWLKTSEKGIAERKALNNHSICWALQASEFARLVGESATRDEIRAQYKSIFIPDQMGSDGSFPRELARTSRIATPSSTSM